MMINVFPNPFYLDTNDIDPIIVCSILCATDRDIIFVIIQSIEHLPVIKEDLSVFFII